jgi:hypothetical protein
MCQPVVDHTVGPATDVSRGETHHRTMRWNVSTTSDQREYFKGSDAGRERRARRGRGGMRAVIESAARDVWTAGYWTH